MRSLVDPRESMRQRIRILEGELTRVTRLAQKMQADLMAIAPLYDAVKAQAKVAVSIMKMVGDEENWRSEVHEGNERLVWVGPSVPVQIVQEGEADLERAMREIHKRYTVRRIVPPS